MACYSKLKELRKTVQDCFSKQNMLVSYWCYSFSVLIVLFVSFRWLFHTLMDVLADRLQTKARHPH